MTANASYPLISFDDLESGLKMMTDVLGFEEGMIFRDESGVIQHCEVKWGDSIVMPMQRRDESLWTIGATSIFLSTTDPDSLHTQAVAAGLEIVMPLTDQDYGSREFAMRDKSNNVWIFGTYQPAAS